MFKISPLALCMGSLPSSMSAIMCCINQTLFIIIIEHTGFRLIKLYELFFSIDNRLLNLTDNRIYEMWKTIIVLSSGNSR